MTGRSAARSSHRQCFDYPALSAQTLSCRWLQSGWRSHQVGHHGPVVRAGCCFRRDERARPYVLVVTAMSHSVARPATSATGLIRNSLSYRLMGFKPTIHQGSGTSDFGVPEFECPTGGSPGGYRCETNQIHRTRSLFLACTLCSGGPRCAWTVLDEISPPVGSSSLFCLTSPPCRPTKSKAAQGRPRMTFA